MTQGDWVAPPAAEAVGSAVFAGVESSALMDAGVANGTSVKGNRVKGTSAGCAAKEDAAGKRVKHSAASHASEGQKFAALKRRNNARPGQRGGHQRKDMPTSLTVTRSHACADEAMG